MKVLHILKEAPDGSTKKIIEIHAAGNTVSIVDLTAGGIAYDKLVAGVFASDRVFCW